MDDLDFEEYLKKRQGIINTYLLEYLPQEDTSGPTIYKSMRYSLMAGGKRLRPILAIAASNSWIKLPTCNSQWGIGHCFNDVDGGKKVPSWR